MLVEEMVQLGKYSMTYKCIKYFQPGEISTTEIYAIRNLKNEELDYLLYFLEVDNLEGEPVRDAEREVKELAYIDKRLKLIEEEKNRRAKKYKKIRSLVYDVKSKIIKTLTWR